jgi:hypothetical protein
MKKLFFFIVFAGSNLFALDMIADIKGPVLTDFGLYSPFPVNITPAATPYDVGENLDKVVNFDSFAFSQPALALLKKNQFVVTPSSTQHGWGSASGFNEMFDIYNYAREHNLPIFVTTDVLLHSFHLCFDHILKTCEEKRFFRDLNNLLDGLLESTQAQYSQSQNETVKSAALININYLIVAKTLLDSTFVGPINGGPYLQELENIRQANSKLVSPIFGYEEDYTQYIPRGHYTRSDSLKSFFRSMMWLGRMTFACENTESQASRSATRSALLLNQAMAKLHVENKPAITVWDAIYQPTVFFVGKSDDITFYPYNEFAVDVYGNNLSTLGPDIFADETKLTAFLEKTKELEAAAITYPGQPSKGFRFMGQRFIPDSWVLDELVQLKTAGRTMPTGLDVMIVLGSERARDHLSEADKTNPSYQANLQKLVNTFNAYPDSVWAQNAYWNWLYSLMPLLAPKGPGYPFFMQSPAWADKDLFAALASWAELRHDTILYAKQSGTETSMPPSAIEHQGYVEPNPQFYGRLASLSDFMIKGLNSRDLLFPSFEISLKKMFDLSLHLQDISEKELTNVPLSSENYLTIFNIGKTLYDIVTFAQWPGKGPLPEEHNEDLEPMPIIADVHTDDTSGLVLEEGVGFPYHIYAICNIEDRPTIAMGAGFSYYEFTWPRTDRLTDEKWRDMLVSSAPPILPNWTDSFKIANNTKTNPDFYVWEKPEDLTIAVDLFREYAVGDTVVFKIKTNNPWESSIPTANVTFSDGYQISSIEMTSMSSEQGAWLGSFSTKGRPSGRIYIDISAGSGIVLNYRASTVLTKITSVNSNSSKMVTNFKLYQNFPNPFNPVTAISFDIPKEKLVTVDIYNINGQFIKEIVGDRLSAGSYTFYWQGKNYKGHNMSSGIYFYKITAGDFVEKKRMLLLR